MEKKKWYLGMSLALVLNITFIVSGVVTLLSVTAKLAVVLATLGVVMELALFVLIVTALLSNKWPKLVKFGFKK